MRQLVPQLEPVDRPDPDPVLLKGCPPPPVLPPRSSLPANDVRPLIAILAQRGDRGEQCAIVVEGWKAWDVCMRIRTKDPKAACPDLDAIVRQLQPIAAGDPAT